MYRELRELILYSDLDRHDILPETARICLELDEGRTGRDILRARLYRQVKRLLDMAAAYGFDGNLWHDYLTWVMVSHQHAFGLAAEGAELGDGTIHRIAVHDFGIFRRLFHYDFSALEEALQIDIFGMLTDYQAMLRPEPSMSRDVSDMIHLLSMQIAHASTDEEVFFLMAGHYRMYGMGLFGIHRAFRVESRNGLRFVPVIQADPVLLSDLAGYDAQKAELRHNVECFLNGRPYNHMLLYGDPGTGKTACVRACLNEYWQEGLRVIEPDTSQFSLLIPLMNELRTRRYRFMVFLDDLSPDMGTEENKRLKAVIDGGLTAVPDNVMIAAASTCRRLVSAGRQDGGGAARTDGAFGSCPAGEALSLAACFGCLIRFDAPDRKLFHEICLTLARRRTGTEQDDEELLQAADRFELLHGGLSGRTAQQFINTLSETEEE